MTYAERKNTLSKKDIASMSKWAAQRPNAADEAAKISQQRRNLWDALHDFIRKGGGAIVSLKYENPVRLEIPVDSPLADKLRELGWTLIDRGQETRIGPQMLTHDLKGRPKDRPALGSGYAFNQRLCFDVLLPTK
jgi:hypothetical protein